MKLLKRMLIALLISCSLLLVAPVVTPLFSDSYTVEAASVKLNKKSLTLGVGTTYNLKISGTKKKVTWSSSKKSVAKVSSNGKVTAVKSGTATITAKVGNKKYKCTVKVTKSPKLTYKVTSAKQSGDWYIIQGKVYNKTHSDLDSVAIQFNLYDKNKKKITTAYDSVYWLDDAGTWKFYIKTYVGSKKVKSYKKSELKGNYNTYVNNLTKFTTKITSMKAQKTYSSENLYKIKGTIKNNNNSKLTDVFATYAFYDKSGNLVGTSFRGYYKGYKKGAKFNFSESAYIESALKVKKCKVVEVHGYNL